MIRWQLAQFGKLAKSLKTATGLWSRQVLFGVIALFSFHLDNFSFSVSCTRVLSYRYPPPYYNAEGERKIGN